MGGKRTGVSPLLEELIVETHPFLNLGKMGSPARLPEKIPFVDLEGFAFFKVDAVLGGSDSERELRKSAAISFCNFEKDFSQHGKIDFSRFTSWTLY